MYDARVLIREADDDDVWVAAFLLQQGEPSEAVAQAFIPIGPDGEELVGRKPAADSLSSALSQEDFDALLLAAPARGFVALPASNQAALATATRGVMITADGNLGVEAADGSNNNGALIPVTAGQLLPLRVVKFTAGNSAGALGLV